MKGLDPEKLAADLRKAPGYVPIPDYAYDCHTITGKRMGKTKADFFREGRGAEPVHSGIVRRPDRKLVSGAVRCLR